MPRPPRAKKAAKLTKAQQEQELGKMLISIYETGYLDVGQLYRNSFIKGMLAGLGGVIGATIVVALLLWVLTLFNEVPLIGRFTQKVQQTVQTAQ